MKIALIQSPVWGTFDPPLALAQLSACLKEKGYDVKSFDFNIELYLNRKGRYKDLWAWEQSDFWYKHENVKNFFEQNNLQIESLVDKMLGFGINIFCFSVATSSYLASLELSRIIKRKNPDSIIVFGGTLFFNKGFINKILEYKEVDIVAYGEGEITLVELVKMIDESKDLVLCQGIVFKKNGKAVINEERPLISNLDTLPFLDFSNLSCENYDDPYHLPLLASRGCVQGCVFCSSKSFWHGYRTMGGERIFREIEFHRNNNNLLGHIDFLDLLFNGSMRSLNDFCDLMIKTKLGDIMRWSANAIIRPEMTLEVTEKMKRAGCIHLIYGIESGSQSVLDLMRKRYKITDADKVLKATHDAGITTTANFMFGFPGETEKDFDLTLDFIRRNSKYLDRAYPSRTYCAIEESSYLYSHIDEFDIKPGFCNHLHWESKDGSNTYPERLRRCEEFSKLALSLNIEVGCGVQTSVELDKLFNLGEYYEVQKDYNSALDYYLEFYEYDNKNEVVLNRLKNIYSINNNNPEICISENNVKKIKDILGNVNFKELNSKVDFKIRREKSLALEKVLKKENMEFNSKECSENKIALHSVPKLIFIQASGPCNASCAFCSRGTDYELFNLEEYRRRFEDRLIMPICSRIECIALTGSGEFLLLKEGEAILDYFDKTLPHVNKMFFTNGSSLTSRIAEKVAYSKSSYTIHVSLHASNAVLHKTLTRSDEFYRILGNLDHFLKLKRQTGNTIVNLTFIATTLNMEDLPNFVRLAANLGVDKVICNYNSIYIPSQKYLSCFFKQDLANRMISEAEEVAKKMNVKISLPPKFNQEHYPDLGICREPWSQIMIDSRGRAIPCDVSEDCNESLENKEFHEIWNSQYYKNLREGLIKKTAACFKHCIRANPASVNDFKSHVIRRGNKDDINILWGDNF